MSAGSFRLPLRTYARNREGVEQIAFPAIADPVIYCIRLTHRRGRKEKRFLTDCNDEDLIEIEIGEVGAVSCYHCLPC